MGESCRWPFRETRPEQRQFFRVAQAVFIAGLFVLAAKELAADSSRGFFRRETQLTVETCAKTHSLALIWADGCLSSRITGTKLGLWNFAFYVVVQSKTEGG
jgi:hypothetical protein